LYLVGSKQNNLYTVVINGKPNGPYTLNELSELEISPGTFIKKEGMVDYKEAHELEEIRELFGLKTIKVAPQYYASLERRLMATLFDIFSVFLFHAVIVSVLFLLVPRKQQLEIIQYASLSVPLVFYLYLIIAEASSMQATFGKKALGIKVSDLNGDRITFGTSLTRNLGKIVCNLTLGIGYLIGIFSSRNQCLHDTMADTLVIKSRLY
jgi:uncharacterized RDD family membrane protein YckC